MTTEITRYGIGPRMSEAVAHNGTLYLGRIDVAVNQLGPIEHLGFSLLWAVKCLQDVPCIRNAINCMV